MAKNRCATNFNRDEHILSLIESNEQHLIKQIEATNQKFADEIC